MSLDVYLTMDVAPLGVAADFLDDHGFDVAARYLRAVRGEEVYSANITHNLNKMADAAGIYEALWRPDEIGITKAAQLIEPLRAGLEKLQANPAHFEQFNASNGWGMYEHLVPWVAAYLAACKEHPDAVVSVSR